MIYARIEPNDSITEHDLDPALISKWVADGNVKATIHFPLVVDAQPTPSSAQVVVFAGYVREPSRVRKSWGLRAKTQTELDSEDDAAELEAIKAARQLLRAEIGGTSSLTAAQFRLLAARCLLWLLRRQIGGA